MNGPEFRSFDSCGGAVRSQTVPNIAKMDTDIVDVVDMECEDYNGGRGVETPDSLLSDEAEKNNVNGDINGDAVVVKNGPVVHADDAKKSENEEDPREEFPSETIGGVVTAWSKFSPVYILTQQRLRLTKWGEGGVLQTPPTPVLLGLSLIVGDIYADQDNSTTVQ